jgi:UbiA prenyltransferase family
LDAHRSHEASWIALLKLIRIPNAFTVIADVLAGAAVGLLSWQPTLLVLMMVVATLFFYWSGMILNDIYDVEKDRIQNRNRPLVSGEFSIQTARKIAWSLILLGLSLVVIASWIWDVDRATPMNLSLSSSISDSNSLGTEPTLSPLIQNSTVCIAASLVLFIWLYDGPLKATFAGPIFMGLCRVCSLLIGISLGWWNAPIHPWELPHFWLAAAGQGVFVMGLTWAARREAEAKQNLNLPLGWCGSLLGIAMLAMVSMAAPHRESLRIDANFGYPVAIGLLAFPWARRALQSVLAPSPTTIQLAVKQAIMSIIFFDAMLALQFAGPKHAIVICALIFPAMTLGKKFRST